MQTSTKLVPGEIDKMITYGRIYKMKKLLGIVVLGLLLSGNLSLAEDSELDISIKKATQETDIIKINEAYSLKCEAEIEDFALAFSQKVVKSKTLISEAIIGIEGEEVYIKINSKINSNGKLSKSKVKVHYSPDMDKDTKNFIKPHIGMLKQITKEGFVNGDIQGKTLVPIQIEDKKKTKLMLSLLKKVAANDSEMKSNLKKLKLKLYDHYLGTANIQSEKFYILKHYMTLEHPDQSFLDDMGEPPKTKYTIIHIPSGYVIVIDEEMPLICTIYKEDEELIMFDTSDILY